MSDLAYIECKGVRVPADWTIRQLRIALAKRFIRFAENDEHDIVRVFGDAIKMKAGLQEEKPVVMPAKASTAKRIPKRKYERRKAKTGEKHG